MKFDEIGFIGLGLIGGSIAKKIKELYPDTKIIATAGHPETVKEAYREGLILNQEPLPLSAFSGCDLIFLCAPVQRNLDYLHQLKDVIKSSCYITDVGSVKGDIHRKVAELGLEEQFIGGHPMTGSEKTGITNADPALLKDAYYIITPTGQTPAQVTERFRRLVTELGSVPIILDCDTHDRAAAAISHLPHIIAFSLVSLVEELDDENGTMKTIAAGGFKDLTRIASSSPVMWQNICLSNREQLVCLLDSYIKKLREIRSYIDAADGAQILSFLQSAKEYRDSFTPAELP